MDIISIFRTHVVLDSEGNVAHRGGRGACVRAARRLNTPPANVSFEVLHRSQLASSPLGSNC